MNTKIGGRGVTRRRALGMAGAAGAAYAVGPLRPFSPGDGAADPERAAAASCVLAPEVTEGPYWVDVREKRSDVRAGQEGVPLVLDLYVYRADDACEPQAGAVVDIWHANASGLYSDEASNDTSGSTWLRGYQETDSSGHVRFTTVYPSWYRGRTIHVHVRVRVFSGATTTYDFTTQVFFDEAGSAAVLATSPYDERSGRDTTNANDMIYQQEASAGNVLMPALAGSAAAGYSGTVGIGLGGLPASTAGGGSTSGGGSSSSKTVEAKLLSEHWERGGGRRELVLALDCDERVAAEARVLRAGRTVAHKRVAALGKGKRAIGVPMPTRLGSGAARLQLTVTDREGNEKTMQRRVRVPASHAGGV